MSCGCWREQESRRVSRGVDRLSRGCSDASIAQWFDFRKGSYLGFVLLSVREGGLACAPLGFCIVFCLLLLSICLCSTLFWMLLSRLVRELHLLEVVVV